MVSAEAQREMKNHAILGIILVCNGLILRVLIDLRVCVQNSSP